MDTFAPGHFWKQPTMNAKHKNLTLDQAEHWKATGLMTEDEFKAYFHEWSQAPRFAIFCKCDVCKASLPARFLPE